MGQAREGDGFLYGRIGFEAEGGVTEVWDPVRLDFAEVAIPSGVTSPFVLRLADLVMVFQTRGAIIKINTFIGAMQALLREATGEDWSLVSTRRRVDFDAWRMTVDRVTRARFHLERPNPNYEGRPFVEGLLEPIAAAAGKIELANPDGLVTDADIMAQLLDHVQRGYGDATIVGQRDVEGRSVEAVYDTRLQGESELHERPADEDGDVSLDELLNELTEGGEDDDSGIHG
jgi:hypothetical protein